ncbi:MAG: PTS sugar transporter subunit IIA [Deltaproteobacteria bacterium]|nr:PTS sugar transporter subunit IIA [Deltaproteobacteria bacterium]MDQ3298992.1 PTS sugar transporter subunit IIA [Myxococcota bacterium]
MAKKSGTDAQLLTMHELAAYLHLDEQTVSRLVNAGKIPAVQVDRQWRFKRSQIDGWIEEQLVGEDESFADVPDGMKLPLEDLLPDQAIITNLRARTPVGVIEELAARAYTNGWLMDKPWFVGAVVERESLSSTAMEGGVAFLHTRAKDKGKIGRPFVIVGRSWEGIMFGAPDQGPTYLFFLLGLKYDRLHLPILGRLARALRNPATIARLRAMSSPDQLRALLLKEDANARAGTSTEFATATAFKPKLDRQLRLRAIRRLQQQKKADITTEEKRAAALANPKRAKAKAKPKPKSGPKQAGPITPPSTSAIRPKVAPAKK